MLTIVACRQRIDDEILPPVVMNDLDVDFGTRASTKAFEVALYRDIAR